MATPGWSTQQLAEFVAAVSAAESEAAAALTAVERAAETLDADVAAIVGRELVAAVGYPDGTAPGAELEAVKPGLEGSSLDVPGVGTCTAAAADLDHPPGATLIVARRGPDGMTREETGLLRGMARVASLTMRLLRVVDEERAARERVEELAREQAALRRVATLVAEAASPDAVFSAVAEEVARLSEADIAKVLRYEDDGAATVVGGYGDPESHLPTGARLLLAGEGVGVLVRQTGQSAWTERFMGPPGSVAERMRLAGARSGGGSPIVVDGRLWGVVMAATMRPEPLPRAIGSRVEGFTTLAATAIANAHAQEALRRLADEQAALRRVATLVARGTQPAEVFGAVAEEVGKVIPGVDIAFVSRYEAEQVGHLVGAWSRTGDHRLVGLRVPLGGRNVHTLVFDTERTARVDRLADDAVATSIARGFGARSSAGAPIGVAGRLWGVIVVSSEEEEGLPTGVEHRLADFAELVATAIANAQAREELRALADEQAALRRVATLVAGAAPPEAVLTAVAEEVAGLLPAEIAVIGRYGDDDTVTFVGGSTTTGAPIVIGTTNTLSGRNVSTLVHQTGQPARLDSYADASGDGVSEARALNISSTVGVPITVAGRLWGVVVTAATGARAVPPGTEERMVAFTELIATAVANAEARSEVRALADEQAALRRVATLVARGVPADEIFDAVTAETSRVLGVDASALVRLESDGSVTVVAADSSLEVVPGVGERVMPQPGTSVERVLSTGRRARIDAYEGRAGSMPERLRGVGYRGSAGAPVAVGGRIWGAMVVSWAQARAIPPGSEERLEQFTELVATAIANAEAQAELTSSRARIVASADETRRKIERDLHDGAQQQLVTLSLQLRAAAETVPDELDELTAELGGVASGLASALEELREFARGIHPAILVERGLAGALQGLARRSAVAVDLDMRTGEWLPEPIEVGAYYVVSEALANVAKHAHATVATVAVETLDGVLRVAVRDDGVGGAAFAPGSGLVGLKDRVEALGGRISLESPPGAGTSLGVELPLHAGRRPGIPASR